MRDRLDVQAFHEALDRIWSVVRAANGYVDRQAPWALKKTDPIRMAAVLYVLAEVLRHLGVLIQPFMPTAAGALLDQLAVAPDRRTLAALVNTKSRLVAGTPLPKPAGIFPRFTTKGDALESGR